MHLMKCACSRVKSTGLHEPVAEITVQPTIFKGNQEDFSGPVMEKNIFESGFDSFEFDDGFLLQVDSDLKKDSLRKKEFSTSRKVKAKGVETSVYKENKQLDTSAKFYDLPLFIEDLNESDFFDFSKTLSSKQKAQNACTDKKGMKLLTSSSPATCLSPILGPKHFPRSNISASTPLKPDDNSGSDEKQIHQKHLGRSPKNSEFDYLEADLFDDWDVDEINKCATQRETVTLSQALKLIEAESAEESASIKAHNESIDLLTGEVVTADVDSLFAQSFDVLKPTKRCDSKEESAQDDVIIDKVIVRSKPSAAQKLNFDSKNTNCINLDGAKDFGSICFGSDDDFDFFTQDLVGKLNKNSEYARSHQGVSSLGNKDTDGVTVLKDCDLNDSSEAVINLKRRRSINVIESDTTEESPSPKFRRQRKSKTRDGRNFQDDAGRDFFDLEAEVSEEVQVSSDEVEEDGEYDQSFLDEESYFTQNRSADMTAKYLQSVKGFSRAGTFKIPATKPYNPDRVFSQVVEEDNTDYQINSFCVNDVEEETKTDLSDLEIAEKILEMDKKKRRKKRCQKSKKMR